MCNFTGEKNGRKNGNSRKEKHTIDIPQEKCSGRDRPNSEGRFASTQTHMFTTIMQRREHMHEISIGYHFFDTTFDDNNGLDEGEAHYLQRHSNEATKRYKQEVGVRWNFPDGRH